MWKFKGVSFRLYRYITQQSHAVNCQTWAVFQIPGYRNLAKFKNERPTTKISTFDGTDSTKTGQQEPSKEPRGIQNMADINWSN